MKKGYSEEQRIKHNKAVARYWKRNKKKIKEREKIYRQTKEYKEQNRIRVTEWRKNNLEKVLAISRKSWNKNADKINKKRRLIYKNNVNKPML